MMYREKGLSNLVRLQKTTDFMIVVLFLLLGVSETTAFPATPFLPHQELTPVETMIQVGNISLNFKVIKGGSLTILLESGGGNDSTEWAKIAPDLAQKSGATVVFYDRAGFGKSDLPETSYDMREELDWLWHGLEQLGLDENLILVGHSYGGWLIRLIANDHPGAVRGMVFVDPFNTDFVEALGVEYLDNHPMMGKLPFSEKPPETLTKIQRALVRMVGKGLGPKVEVMRETIIPKGMPARVITSGKPFLPKPEEQQAWRQAHEKLAASIDGAVLLVAERSGHMIPWAQPDIIVDAIMEITRLIE